LVFFFLGPNLFLSLSSLIPNWFFSHDLVDLCNRDDLVEAISKLSQGGGVVAAPAPVSGGSVRVQPAGMHFHPQKLIKPSPIDLPHSLSLAASSVKPGEVSDQKKALEAFVENAKYLLSIMNDGSPSDIVASSTNLVKSVRTVLDLPDLQGKIPEETKGTIVQTLGVLISNAKLVATGDQNAKAKIQSVIPTLIRSVNQLFSQTPAPQMAQPLIRPQASLKVIFISCLLFFFFFFFFLLLSFFEVHPH